MLFVAAIVCGVNLAVTNVIALKAKQKLWVIPCSLALAMLPCGLGGYSLTTLESGFALALLMTFTLIVKRPKLYCLLSVPVVALVFGANVQFAWIETAALKAQYPFESMEARSGTIARRTTTPTLSAEADSQLAEMEDRVQNGAHFGAFYSRDERLRILHENTLQVFESQPNFGVWRMSRLVTKENIESGLREDAPLMQPGLRSPSPWFSDAPEATKRELAGVNGNEMHFESVLDFIHVKGWGYLKDRRHVAGFQSHMFSQTPKSPERWKLESIELVGLVTHDSPVVYISEHLPRMDELRAAPYRAPDEFEELGLKELRAGLDIYVRGARDDRLRMLGSIRCLKQCIDCHGGDRGTLLGAFSYELSRDNGTAERK